MHTNFILKRLAAALVALATLLSTGAAARAGTFPSLNDPMTVESHPGKFVWAELFTTDIGSATRFYSGVLGWTVTTLDQHGVQYTVLSSGGHPVAGLRQRDSSASKRASRWIDYIAVTDIAPVLSAVSAAGGVIRAPARNFPDIGIEAIITDNGGSPVGLLQSSSGDSADREPPPGDWNWFHLIARDPQAAAAFYKQVFGYDVAPDARLGRKTELLLSTDGINRGGITQVPDRAGAKPGWLGIVRVASLDETLARVPTFDGQVIVAPHAAAFGSRFAVIADPTGGTIGLVEYLNNANPVSQP